MGSGSLIVLINLAGGWWFIRRYVVHPVTRLGETSHRLAQGDLQARVSLQGRDEPAEVWYLFAAWMLAAVMNAMLTWWGVSIALLNHQSLGNAVVERATLLKVVPIFVAVMVWLIRVLIIGTLSIAGDRIFSQVDLRKPVSRSAKKTTYASQQRTSPRPAATGRSSSLPRGVTRGVSAASYNSYRPAPKPEPTYEDDYASQEPVYTPVSFSGQQKNNRQTRF